MYPEWLENWWIEYVGRELSIESIEEGLVRLEKYIQDLSDFFTIRRPTRWEDYFSKKENRIAYGLFFYPQNFVRIQFPLRELILKGWKPPRHLKILDLAAGTGAASLGASTFLVEYPGVERIDGVALDTSRAALSFFEKLFAENRNHLPGCHWTTAGRDLREPEKYPEGSWDLIFLNFGLNEAFSGLDAEKIYLWIQKITRRLNSTGALVLVEPASKRTSQTLQELRCRVIQDGRIFIWGPCLHNKACPLVKEWCHEVRGWQPPGSLSRLNRHLYRSIEVLKYSFLILSKSARDPLPEGPYIFRLISPVLRARGKFLFKGCASDGNKYDYEILTRDLSRDQIERIRGLERGQDLRTVRWSKKGQMIRLFAEELMPLWTQKSVFGKN